MAEKKKRNPIVAFIYNVYVSPSYLVKSILLFFVGIIGWVITKITSMLQSWAMNGLHGAGGVFGFVAILIDLALATVAWLIVATIVSDPRAFIAGS